MTSGPSALPPRLVSELAPLHALLHGSRNAVFPIVGSGLSGTALPSWSQLLSALIDQAPVGEQAELRGLLTAGKYLEVASLLEDPSEGRARVLTYLRNTYQRPRVAAPPLYEQVAALPVEHLATTNYNPWLKDAVARRHGAAPRVYVPGDPEAFSDLGLASSPLVLMLHGDADRPSSCVLSQRSYRRATYQPAYRAALRGLASQRAFLFIGHSLSDPDLISILEEWAEIFGGADLVPRHVCLGAGFTRHQRLRLTELGVLPVEYGPGNDHSLLPAVLAHLATPPTTVVTSQSQPTGSSGSDRQLVQLLVKLLAGSSASVKAPGTLPHMDTGALRAVDVLVESMVHGERIFQAYEVAEKVGLIDVEWVESMVRKHERLPTHHLYLVSRSGFTDEAAAIARKTPRCTHVVLEQPFVDAPPAIFADEVTLSLVRGVAQLRVREGELRELRVNVDQDVAIFDEHGTDRGSLWALCVNLVRSPVVGEEVSKVAHSHPRREEMTWFTLTVPASRILSGPLFLRTEDGLELHRLVELELVGQMTFQQARVDLAALEFRGRPMGAGAVTVGGRNLKIVASLDANGKTTAVEVEPAPGTSAGRPRPGVVDDG
jgi:hypothetical protein